jgi:hypothetical protein
MPRKITRPKTPARPPRKTRPRPGSKARALLWLGAIVLLAFFSVLAVTKGGGVRFTKHNEEIDSKERDDIHRLNQILLDALTNRDFSIIKENVPPDLVKNFDDEQGTALYGKLKWFLDPKPPFKVFNDYHVTALKLGHFTASIPSQTTPPFTYRVACREIDNFVSMMVSSAVNSQKMLLLCNYEKKGGRWWLVRFHVGLYEINGLDPMGWATRMQELFDQKKVGAAFLGLQVLGQFYRPDDFFQYLDENNWKQLFNEVAADYKADYQFPFTFSNLPGRPMVFGAQMEMDPEGPTVAVRYRTNLKLRQTKQVEAEARLLGARVEDWYPRINQVARHAKLIAFENDPSDAESHVTEVGLTPP